MINKKKYFLIFLKINTNKILNYNKNKKDKKKTPKKSQKKNHKKQKLEISNIVLAS